MALGVGVWATQFPQHFLGLLFGLHGAYSVSASSLVDG